MPFEADDIPEKSGQVSTIWKTLQAALAIVLFVFCLGVMFGAGSAGFERGAITPGIVITIAIALVIAAACGWWVMRLDLFGSDANPLASSTKKSRLILWLSTAFGVVIGIIMGVNGVLSGSPYGLFSNDAVPAGIAIALIASWVIFIPLIAIAWHRTIDEHEALANGAGAIAGIYAYLVITPVWWMGERAGLFPPQQPMIVFSLVIVVFSIVWLHKRA